MTELQVKNLRMTMTVSRMIIMKILMMRMTMVIMTMPVKLKHLMPRVFLAGIKLMLWLEHSSTYVV